MVKKTTLLFLVLFISNTHIYSLGRKSFWNIVDRLKFESGGDKALFLDLQPA